MTGTCTAFDWHWSMVLKGYSMHSLPNNMIKCQCICMTIKVSSIRVTTKKLLAYTCMGGLALILNAIEAGMLPHSVEGHFSWIRRWVHHLRSLQTLELTRVVWFRKLGCYRCWTTAYKSLRWAMMWVKSIHFNYWDGFPMANPQFHLHSPRGVAHTSIGSVTLIRLLLNWLTISIEHPIR